MKKLKNKFCTLHSALCIAAKPRRLYTLLSAVCVMAIAVCILLAGQAAKAPEVADNTLKFVVGDFPAYNDIQPRAIGSPDAGKTEWADGDQLIVTISGNNMADQSLTLTLSIDAEGKHSWTPDKTIKYDKAVVSGLAVTAIYAPCYEVDADGNKVLKEGMQLGMTEYLEATCSESDGKVTISFGDVTRNYSRLRIAGAANATYTVATTNFTPVGNGTAPADGYSLTTNEIGNTYLYGTFAKDATVTVKDGETELRKHTFTDSATEDAKSYVICIHQWNEGTCTVCGSECAHPEKQVAYTWADDYSTCTANVTCSVCGMVTATETATATSSQNAEGNVTYTVDFTGADFADQTFTTTSSVVLSGTSATVTVPTTATPEDVKAIVAYALNNGGTQLTVSGITGEGEAQQALVVAVAEAIGEFETEATGPNVATVSLTMPDLKEISRIYLFYPCYALKEVDFPVAQTIGELTLSYAASLQKVSLASATELSRSVFSGCSSLTEVYAPEVLTVEEGAFRSCTSLTSIDLPKATSIGSKAFWQCSALQSIHLPSVTTLGEDAFAQCQAITSMRFGSKITAIGQYAFSFNSANCDLQLVEGQKVFSNDDSYNYSITDTDFAFDGTSWAGKTWKSISKYTATEE